MRNIFAAGLSALLVVFVLAWLPANGGIMDKEKVMDKSKTMAEKPSGAMMDKKHGMEGQQESMMDTGSRKATLVGAAGHHAAGTALLAKDGAGTFSLTFSNLDVDRVPDGRVYLAKHGDHTKGIEVGKLTMFQGAVTFMIPERTNLDEYDSVVIWCKRFWIEVGHGTFMGGSNKGL